MHPHDATILTGSGQFLLVKHDQYNIHIHPEIFYFYYQPHICEPVNKKLSGIAVYNITVRTLQ